MGEWEEGSGRHHEGDAGSGMGRYVGREKASTQSC